VLFRSIALAAEHAESLCRAIQRDDPRAAIIGVVGKREREAVVLL
jgi:hypothetical protein